jgi:hypothetical protein
MMLRTGPTLVLQKFDIDAQAGTVNIIGRAPGIMSWLFAKIGLDATTSLSCDPTQVSFRTSSLRGEKTSGIAMPAVASVVAGYSKPIGFLILAGLLLLGGIGSSASMAMEGMDGGGMAFGVSLVLAIVCVVAYALQKSIVLAVETSGGAMFGLTFKRSVMEGVAMDVTKAQAAMAVINTNVVRAYQRAGS